MRLHRILAPMLWVMALLLVSMASVGAFAADVLWEDGESLYREWTRTGGTLGGSVAIASDHVTEGKSALAFTVQAPTEPLPKDKWVQFKTFVTAPSDWSDRQTLAFDLYNGHTGSIWLSVYVFQGTTKLQLTAYAQQSPGWRQISLALPAGLTNVSCVELVFNASQTNGHTIYIDNMRLQGETAKAPAKVNSRYLPLQNGSFENGAAGWTLAGAASIGAQATYFGTSGLQFTGAGSARQEIRLAEADVPKAGDVVEAGCWVMMPPTAGATPPSLYIEAVTGDAIAGEAVSAGKSVIVAASAADAVPATARPGQWGYVKTKPVGSVPSGTTRLVATLRATGPVYADYVQLGTAGAVRGVPQKAVLLHVMPWFSTAEGDWNHWKYGSHYPFVRLTNGRRDIASVYYPYIGPYRSDDPDVIDYQTDLAIAMGIDVIDIDWYGFQHQSQYAAVVDAFLAAAERKGLKVSVRYEPKVHTIGWVPHTTRTEAVAAVAQDIIGLVQRWGNRKGYLHIDGIPVVGTFGMLQLSSAEWQTVYDQVKAAVGDVHLMGDQAPSDQLDAKTWYPMFRSTFKWSLYTASVDNNLAALRQYADRIQSLTKRWADAGDRMGIAIVYPGFDDTAVNGWGEGARTLRPKTDEFYAVTLQSAQASGLSWALIATLNDWNEGTSIEPAIVEQFGLTRANATRQWTAAFKNEGPSALTVEEVVDSYYNRIFKDRYN